MKSLLWTVLGLGVSLVSYASQSNEFEFDVPFSLESISPQKDDLKVLWWNVQFGETNRLIQTQNNSTLSPLDKNILELIQSPLAPDVIMFGEFSDDSFLQSTIEKIKKLYPYYPDKFWPYNPDTPERGIIVFSKYPLRVARQALLDYYPLNFQSSDEIKRYKSEWAKDFPPERFFPRTYLNIELTHPQGKAHLVPFHGLIHVEKQYKESEGGFWPILKIKFSVAFGSENPMIYQLQRLKEELKKDFGEKSETAPFVVLGDFNLPRKIFGLRTKAYKVASSNLQDAFEDNETSSWPMPSSKEFKEISIRAQIDHAFCSQKLTSTNAVIIPFKGSDHAAILVAFRPKK